MAQDTSPREDASDLAADLVAEASALRRLLEDGSAGSVADVDAAFGRVAGRVRLLGEALAAEHRAGDTQRPAPAAPVEVIVPVLGVDACAAGWVGAILEPGAPRPRIAVAATITGLVETVRESLGIQAVAIDIPMGLPDDTTREADARSRKVLKGKASTVFTTLTRAAYAEQTRADADVVNRALTGQGVGAQAFGLRAKILEVDAWLRSRPTVAVFEVHPEVSFAVMAGAPIVPGKKTDEGRRARLAALSGAGVASPSVLTGSGYAADDVLDACAAAWTAARRTTGDARSFPDPPETFSDGIPAAIWA